MHWPKIFGCLVGNIARLSHCAKLWKLRKMAVSGGKRPCRPGGEFSVGPSSPRGRLLHGAEFWLGPSSPWGRVLRYSSAVMAHHACRSVCCIME